jgi:serine/threonine-protein kinase
MILSGQYATEAELRRFRVEAEAAAQLDHPNIVPILEVGRHQGHAFFSMKLVGGGNLTRHLARYQGDHAAVARLTATIARAIDYAHGRGLIHRDLKPSNILIDESGRPLIADFGLVKRTVEGHSLTATGAIMGTPGYMAPEQIAGQAVTVAADVFSLGAILYELLTGRPPFRGAGAAETMARVLEDEPTPPRAIRPTIPRELEFICLKCLEKEPGRRYESAAALADDLERFLQGEDVQVGGPGVVKAIGRWVRREPEFACRLVAQGLVLGLTQLNHLGKPNPNVPVHVATTCAEAAWIASTLLLRRLARVERRWELVRVGCIGIDLILTTAILRLLRADDSSLVVAYAMLITASGLWNRVRLVWLTTALAMLSYSILAADAFLRGLPRDSNHHPNIILTALAVTGLIIAQQVRGRRALTSESAGTS